MRLLLRSCLLFIYCCLVACSEKAGRNRAESADRVEFFYKDGEGVLRYSDSSREVVKTFIEVLNGTTNKRKCATMGEIRFLYKDSILFVAAFSISSRRGECNCIMRGEDAWQLNDAAGTFLTETFNKLKKE